MTTKENITTLIEARNWEGLEHLLRGLSKMEFRRMEHVAREEVLPEMENGLFWEALLHLIIFKRAAFLSGVVAVEHLAKDGTLDFGTESVELLYAHLQATSPEAVVKVCNIMAPHLTTETQMEQMFEAFHVDHEVTRLSVLLKVDTPLSYYLIFKTLKTTDDRFIARKCCMVLVKRQSDMAFNAVSLIKTYFGLDDLPARFSLTVEPYELSHIDRNLDTFLHVLNGKRPKL